ncbi:hypothetical protein ACFY2Z_40490 [Streptomyces sp. NPDC001222]|uniref:hypothetical protein n=1 Tax=Streptomyces sp. NPDC001222 TaxID=3364548 RepID=UPI0036AFA806
MRKDWDAPHVHVQEQQYGGSHEREDSGAADELGGQRQLLVHDAGEFGEDRTVEGE